MVLPNPGNFRAKLKINCGETRAAKYDNWTDFDASFRGWKSQIGMHCLLSRLVRHAAPG